MSHAGISGLYTAPEEARGLRARTSVWHDEWVAMRLRVGCQHGGYMEENVSVGQAIINTASSLYENHSTFFKMIQIINQVGSRKD